MRTIIYAIIDMETKEKIYQNCHRNKCENVLETLPNKDKCEIRYKWMSF